MSTTTMPRIPAVGCQSILGDSEVIPPRYWNPGMELTRGLLGGGFCTDAASLSVNNSGSMIRRGCWTSEADLQS
jgi:hypothetical protein